MRPSPEAPSQDLVRPAGRGRLAPVLRLLLVGTLVAAVLSPVHLVDWSAGRAWLANSSAVQAALQEIDEACAAISFSRAYDWLRRQTRAAQALRFNGGEANQQ